MMLNTQSSPTRDKVLGIIKREAEVTVKQLTTELEITPMAIRGHLSKLEKDQLIKVGNLKQKLGRPLQVFSLTEKGDACFPKNYGQFSVDILESLQELDDGHTLNKVVAIREGKIIQERIEYLSSAGTAEEKMTLYTQYLDEMGYMPQLVKTNETQFILHENNCALKDIANNFSFCCSSEMNILKAVFSEAKVSRIANQLKCDSKCSYQFDF